ncbi:exopolysaccharide biosynthesis protein, partial [Streptococcus danieliae]|nr:exopolysaccharide biosynthesis protein [Streptococcus danieliae]
MDVKILVAAYKEVDLHKSNIYLPVQVRTELNNTVK